MTEGSDRGKAFALGIDGVPWGRLREWTDAGHLPNVARLFEEGATGPLESTTLVTTPVAWPSIFTGVRPDQHGIYAFHELTAAHTRELRATDGIEQPTLWDLLSPAAVTNVPMTYPAGEMDGRLVAGMMAPEIDASATHPPDLADEIRERFPDYEPGLSWEEYHGDVDRLTADLSELVAARRALQRWFMETVEDWWLFFTVFTALDRLQHLCWDEETLLSHYALLDDVLGDVLAFVAEAGATLYVVSDHGFAPADRFAYPNAVLEDAGLLATKDESRTRGLMERVGLSKDAVLSGLDRLGIDEETLVGALPERVVHAAGNSLPGDHLLYDVEYDETVAFAGAFGAVYVNDAERFDDGIVAPDDVLAVEAQVREAIEAVRDPATGKRPLTVIDGDEAFPRDERSPDLVVRGAEGYNVKQSLPPSPFADTGDYAAGHDEEGIFLAWGEHVAAGATVSGAHVVDVAPTVLHGAGAAVPGHMDGSVLTETFAAGSEPAQRPVQRSEHAVDATDDAATGDTTDAVEERLRGLGYME